ncbi:MAG: helix-turn-helix transcriptional regulator [Eubacteriales bacterium]|nr:helix-turn-helix transcriptional regulator [Eubacteriales bacterium]
MISYEPLWQTMKQRSVTTYTLITQYGINPRTIHNLKHNKSITMYTLEKLCSILNCTANDVVAFKAPSEEGAVSEAD